MENDILLALEDLEDFLASNNDRTVEEYRSYYPEHVKAIDALRAVVTKLDDAEAYGEEIEVQDIRQAISTVLLRKAY